MDKIQSVVNMLAENYGFDAAEALEFVITTQKEASPAYARAKKAYDTTQAKINELQNKITNRKVRDLAKANEKLDELREKLEQQAERIEEAGKPKPRKPRAVKEKPAPQPEPEPAPAPAPPPKKKEEKRISKMSKSFTDKLSGLFKELGAEMSDKNKKDFVTYVNELTTDDFDAKTLTDHMKEFAELTTKPVGRPVPEDIIELTHAALMSRKRLIEGYGPGIYWDAVNKVFVTGPADHGDDDMAEIEFERKMYAVGEKTARVYRIDDDGDEFVGYAGVGDFKDMKH